MAPVQHGVARADGGAVVRAWVELPGVERHQALDAWADPGLVRAWWGGELQAELRPGGSYVVRFPGLEQTMRGRVLAHEPGGRLAFTWTWDHEPGTPPREVEVRVADTDGGSRLEVEHRGFGEAPADQADAEASEEGWRHFLPRLASTPATGPA